MIDICNDKRIMFEVNNICIINFLFSDLVTLIRLTCTIRFVSTYLIMYNGLMGVKMKRN